MPFWTDDLCKRKGDMETKTIKQYEDEALGVLADLASENKGDGMCFSAAVEILKHVRFVAELKLSYKQLNGVDEE